MKLSDFLLSNLLERGFCTGRCSHCELDLSAADARPLVRKLCSALKHPESEAAVRAAWILGERGESEAVKELICAVENATDKFVVEAAVDALGKLGDARAASCLKVAAGQGTAWVRMAARKALQTLSGKTSDEAIGQFRDANC
jgi:HEAT repeat protein